MALIIYDSYNIISRRISNVEISFTQTRTQSSINGVINGLH